MKSILGIAAASLGLVTLAAVSTPVFASQDRVELRFGNGYVQQPATVQPGVIYGAPAPVYRYGDEAGWRRQQWREQAWRERERERREHYWHERNEWRERQWQEQRERQWQELRERQWQEQRRREHGERADHHDHDRHDNWR